MMCPITQLGNGLRSLGYFKKEGTVIMQVNLFTNCHDFAPDTSLVEKTYGSFVDTFGEQPVCVWCDPHPRVEVALQYEENLLKLFSDVRMTSSLANGYIRSIVEGDERFVFQLEGDWFFHKERISNSLEELEDLMLRQGLYHFRFNKRANIIAGWDYSLLEVKETIPYCVTSNLSNNPHIIDRLEYKNNLLGYLKDRDGSHGIEEELNKAGKFTSGIYGPLLYPAAITHLDGRKQSKLRGNRV